MIKELTMAILAWFAAQNNAGWWECGQRYTKAQMEARAQQYAQVVMEANQRHPYPDGEKILLAMLMQESALDRCNLAGWYKAKRAGKRSWKPTEAQALAELRKATYQRRIDAGVLQRLYPPHQKWYPPEQALNLKFQVGLTASKLPQYLKMCRGNYGAKRTWKVKWTRKRLTCEDVAFTSHNTGGSINLKYHRSVSFQRYRWERQMRKEGSLASL